MKLFSLALSIKKIPKVTWSSEDAFNLKPKPLTLIFLVFGLFLFGLGESLLITSGAGVGPYTVLAQAYQTSQAGQLACQLSLLVFLYY